ncbi:TetR/AcrR family transcriptional regulator [Alcanivorax sp. 521-1]|uniref:TetR/AcrR family transcriptional regulator n=1 Tax=Alloalcanivorax profundimaris TaxID=2735259 RepID=A0ABS0AVM7_9GAMM|nr:TetR/AcrR family transcriptional regulator [Alloalcanivorax profundimaris]MBF5058203.1 TetR/AcrR family transcriptional regulator [Alloalcanivorax profundimaris]MBM1143468.1 TetR/AcrR family transcriptional regulator [Alcanivorax sp. ZXX171]MBU58372.1 TetR family transcriptional regulator [Alcanivorax sp.]UWN48207.1 HTH-type transcriptional repressor NicS [Alcanivorax sp. ALC70]
MKKTTPAKTTRRRGRPADEAGNLRDRLLDSAVRLFGEHGVGGTPLNRIARDAGATPALMHYYFGNKDKLLEAIVEERILTLMAPTVNIVLNADPERPARAVIRDLTRHLIVTVDSAPWLPPLWIKEIISLEGRLRPLLIRRDVPGLFRRLAEIVARGQAEGDLNRDLEPRLFPISLIGLTMFTLASRPIWSRLPGQGDIDTDDLINHVLALLDRGLGGPP